MPSCVSLSDTFRSMPAATMISDATRFSSALRESA
jgi:hypothetical protein